MNRRQIMMTGAAMTAFGTLGRGILGARPALAAEEIFEDDRILGEADAPVTIIEYASLTCPHCASLHKNTLPQLKDTWIKDGRARLVYRDYPLDRVAMTGAMIAHCFEQDQAYFAFLDMLYERQMTWARAENPVEELARMAKLGGIDQERFNACLQDEARLNRILEKAKHGQDTYAIRSTPSLIIGGELYPGNRSFSDLESILEEVAARG